MSRRLPWLLFVISLALNIFFVAGVVFSEVATEQLKDDPEAGVALVSESLGLSEAQTDDLLALRERVRSRWGAMREEGGPLRAAAMAATYFACPYCGSASRTNRAWSRADRLSPARK